MIIQVKHLKLYPQLKFQFFMMFLSKKTFVNQTGVSTMVPVTLPVKLVRHGPTPV